MSQSDPIWGRSKEMAVAIAIRCNKFKRNGRLAVFDPTQISEEELEEARDAIDAAKKWEEENDYE